MNTRPGAFGAFFAGLIDYAGLFPPAALPLDAALRDYARHRNEPDAWMLGAFICPAARLAEITEPMPANVSALGRATAASADFSAEIAADLEAIAAFRARAGHASAVVAYETRVPDAVLAPPAAALAEAGLRAFFEAPPDARFPALAEALRVGPGGAALKLRTGGTQAAQFPAPAAIAAAIIAARDCRLAFKCTAGLHHPVRHFSAGVLTKMHGFLNVFGAALFAGAHGWDVRRVTTMLEDEDAAAFRFEPESFAWRDERLTAGEIAAGRATLALSFGSCSFDEPRDDLRVLGWL